MDFQNTMANISGGLGVASDLLGLMNDVKQLCASGQVDATAFQGAAMGGPPMAPFMQQMADPYGGGQQWIGQLRQMAAQNGNGWVPQQTAGLGGIDLTGLWRNPMNPMEQSYIRQFGPMLNMVAGIGGIPGFTAEGLFDPSTGTVRLVGRYVNGSPGEVNAQLHPNWVIHGVVMFLNPWGVPMTAPTVAQRVA